VQGLKWRISSTHPDVSSACGRRAASRSRPRPMHQLRTQPRTDWVWPQEEPLNRPDRRSSLSACRSRPVAVWLLTP